MVNKASIIAASFVLYPMITSRGNKISIIIAGINKTNSGLVGDVDFDTVSKVAKAITPVPGGVGPMTIACLLNNTVECFKKAQSK